MAEADAGQDALLQHRVNGLPADVEPTRDFFTVMRAFMMRAFISTPPYGSPVGRYRACPSLS